MDYKLVVAPVAPLVVFVPVPAVVFVPVVVPFGIVPVPAVVAVPVHMYNQVEDNVAMDINMVVLFLVMEDSLVVEEGYSDYTFLVAPVADAVLVPMNVDREIAKN